MLVALSTLNPPAVLPSRGWARRLCPILLPVVAAWAWPGWCPFPLAAGSVFWSQWLAMRAWVRGSQDMLFCAFTGDRGQGCKSQRSNPSYPALGSQFPQCRPRRGFGSFGIYSVVISGKNDNPSQESPDSPRGLMLGWHGEIWVRGRVV